MEKRFLHSVFASIIMLLAAMPAMADSQKYTWLDELRTDWGAVYYELDKSQIAADLGLTVDALTEAGGTSVIVYSLKEDGSRVEPNTNYAGHNGNGGDWHNADGYSLGGWSGTPSFYHVVNYADFTIGMGQNPNAGLAYGQTISFQLIVEYAPAEGEAVSQTLDINWKITYQKVYENAVAEAVAALADATYASVTGEARTNLENAVNAVPEQTEEGWLAAANAIKAALTLFTTSVTGAGEYIFEDGPGHTNFTVTYYNIDIEKIANVLGMDATDFTTGFGTTVVLGAYNSDGSLNTSTNAGADDYTGFWLGKDGTCSGWGSKSSIYFVFDPAGRIGIGQMPTTQGTGDKVAAGDAITFTFVLKTTDANAKTATVKVTYKLTYKLWLKYLVESTPDYSSLSDDVYVTGSLLTEYNSLRAEAMTKYDSVNSEEEVMAIYNPLKEALDLLTENMSLWNQYKAAIEQAKEVLNGDFADDDDAVYDLEEALEEANQNLAKATLTTEELKVETEKLNALISEAQSIERLATAAQKLKDNIDLYAEVASTEAKNTATSLYDEVTAHLNAHDITCAEAKVYIVKVWEAITLMRLPEDYATATEENPVDVTDVIDCPSFEKDGTNSFEGWTETGNESHSFGNSDYQRNALLVEYHKIFDLSQTIYGLPNGWYKVTVNSFSRYGSLSNDYAVWSEDNNAQNNAFVYAVTAENDSVKTSVAFESSGASATSLASGSTTIGGKYVPNDMYSAGQWFAEGYYMNTLTAHVQDGQMTIGMKKFENTGDDWLILDNWTMQYLGTKAPTAIRNIENDACFATDAKVEIYNTNGVRQAKLGRGINIVKRTDANGRTIVRKVVIK